MPKVTCEIYLKDACSMKEVEDNSVQLIVTTPSEIKILKVFSPLKKVSPSDRAVLTSLHFPIQNLLKHHGFPFISPQIFMECYRVLKEDGVFLWNMGSASQNYSSMFGANRINCLLPYVYVEYIMAVSSFKIQDDFIWVKLPPGTFHERGNITDAFEHFFLFSKSDKWKFHPKDKEFSTVLLGRAGKKLKEGLPAPFSKVILKTLIETFTDEGDTVLDPFAGTGTLGHVAIRLGRNCILYEVRKELLPIIESTLKGEIIPLP